MDEQQHSPVAMAALTAMQLTDSAAPTGAFSHSFGFESYLSSGAIADEDSFRAWLTMFINQQLTLTDALAIRLVYAADSFQEIAELDHQLTALSLPRQIRKAGMTIGRRQLNIAAHAWPGEWVERYHEGVKTGDLHGHQASIWATVARSLGLDVEAAIAQHLHASVISLTQNAVRAVPLGQNAGQRIIADVRGTVLTAVERSRELDPADLGAVAPGLEIAQMRHERQLARLFMS